MEWSLGRGGEGGASLSSEMRLSARADVELVEMVLRASLRAGTPGGWKVTVGQPMEVRWEALLLMKVALLLMKVAHLLMKVALPRWHQNERLPVTLLR